MLQGTVQEAKGKRTCEVERPQEERILQRRTTGTSSSPDATCTTRSLAPATTKKMSRCQLIIESKGRYPDLNGILHMNCPQVEKEQHIPPNGVNLATEDIQPIRFLIWVVCQEVPCPRVSLEPDYLPLPSHPLHIGVHIHAVIYMRGAHFKPQDSLHGRGHRPPLQLGWCSDL